MAAVAAAPGSEQGSGDSNTSMVTAAGPEVINLDVFSEKAMSFFTVTFALLYPSDGPGRPSVDLLRAALAGVLATHRHMAGRLVRTAGGGLAILCNGAGVPLTHRTCPVTAAP